MTGVREVADTAAKECPYCGRPTPDLGMRCRNRAACAQRADYAYIVNALHPGKKETKP